MIRTVRVIRLLALALCVGAPLGAPAAAAGSECSIKYVTELPLKVAHGRIFVAVRIGRKALPMMLDTGSYISMVSVETSRSVDLRVIPDIGSRFSSQQMMGVGGEREISMMSAPHVHIGDVTVNGMRFAVPSGRPAANAGPDPDLLGMNPLTGYDIDLDLLGNRLVLFQTDESCKHPPVLMDGPFYVAPMAGDPHDTHIGINVTLGDATLLAQLDTGAPNTVMTARAARRTGLTDEMLASDRRLKTAGIGGGGVAEVRHLSAPMTIGKLTVANIRVGIIDETLGDTDMLLGMDFLSKVHTWISNSTRNVVFQVPPTASPPVPGSKAP